MVFYKLLAYSVATSVYMASAIERPMGTSSEEEKTIGEEHLEVAKHVHTIENLPDPDAGLSEEERAAHVSYLPIELKPSIMNRANKIPTRTKPFSANSTSD